MLAVQHCHQNNIAHRNITLDNILINKQTFQTKLIDFGSAEIIKDGKFQKYPNVPDDLYYLPPEVIDESNHYYNGVEIDIWSCGVVLFGLLTGSLPFYHENLTHLKGFISEGEYEIPMDIGPEASDLISLMLDVNAVRRISISEVLTHKWFNDFYTTQTQQSDENKGSVFSY